MHGNPFVTIKAYTREDIEERIDNMKENYIVVGKITMHPGYNGVEYYAKLESKKHPGR